mgnify:CR=1 FL=1
MPMLESALAYVAEGFKVFPCALDKKPLTPHGLKDATITQLGVKEYWTKWPEAAIGLVTDGFVVIDFDAKSGGKTSKTAIEEKYGKLPKTRVHRTGGGGLHYIYRNPNGRDIRNSVKVGGYSGVDLRANGGYIVAPPSPHVSGKVYKVLDSSPIIPAPDWILDLCAIRTQPISEGNADASIQEGQRNATLASMAGAMRRKGMPQSAIEAGLLEVNHSQCNPPLPDEDVLTIAKSISRYPPDPLATDIVDGTDITDEIGLIRHLLTKTDKSPKKLTNPDGTDNSDKVDILEGETNVDRVIWKLVSRWLSFHEGEKFDLDTLCRHLNVTNREHRHSVVKKLAYEVSQKRLEKSVNVRPPIYRLCTSTILRMNWRESKGVANVPLVWPCGQDGTQLGFDGRVQIPEKGLMVLAGVTNVGKSVFCRNFLWGNMDVHHCVYFSSETSEDDFADYASRMTWANPVKEDGTEKFELISRDGNFKDVIQPDSVNIIDWLDIYENFYAIGELLNGMKAQLNKGIILVAIQKDPNKGLGVGGMWAMNKASLYLTMDFNRIKVEKAKKWQDWNPNGHTWGFDIIDKGTHFNNIRLLKKCGACWQGKVKNGICGICDGTGYVSADKL